MMTTPLSYDALEKIASDIRAQVIKSLEEAGSGHPAGSLGVVDILTALYFDIMKHDPSNPSWDQRDIFVLSNGHCAPALYATLAQAGYLEQEELHSLRRMGSRLQGHPEMRRLPGLETTSGPLGCGLSQACGMALAMRLKSQHHRWVYCLTGDGELNEGNVWEAAMFARKYNLHNVIAIVDRNNIQLDGPTEVIMPLEELSAKWEAFGWHVIEIDGHNMGAIIDACMMAKAIVEKPVVIIAHTIPGKGVDFMEYDFHWHGMAPNQEEARRALDEIRTLKGKIRSEHE